MGKKFDLEVYRSNDLSQIYYNDFMDGMDGSSVQTFYGRRSHRLDYVVIYENEAKRREQHFKKSHLAKMRKDDLLKLAMSVGLWWDEDKTKAEIIEDLLSLDNEAFFEAHFENTDYSDLDGDFKVRGYNQGDCVTVKTVGKVGHNSESLTHLFFDSPIYAKLDIYRLSNAELVDEIYLSDYLDDEYTWDREALINAVDKFYSGEFKAEVLSYLATHLPAYLEYKP